MRVLSPLIALAVVAPTSFGQSRPRTHPLIDAVRRGDLAAAREALENEPRSLDASDLQPYAMRPLMESLSSRNSDVARWLIERGADVERRQRGQTPLMWAAAAGLDDVVDELLARGAQRDATDDRGHTALHAAAAFGRTDCVRRLIRAGASAAVRDALGRTPLHAAAAGGHAGACSWLASRDVNERGLPTDRFHVTPLHMAAAHAHAEAGRIVAVAAKVSKDMHQTAGVDERTLSGKTALHFAARGASLELVNALVRFGADPSARDVRDWTPEDYARNGDAKLVMGALRRKFASSAPTSEPSPIVELGSPPPPTETVLSMHVEGGMTMPGEERSRGLVTVSRDGLVQFGANWPNLERRPRTRRLSAKEMEFFKKEVEETGILDMKPLFLSGPDLPYEILTVSIGGRTARHAWSQGVGASSYFDVSTLEATQAWELVERIVLDLAESE